MPLEEGDGKATQPGPLFLLQPSQTHGPAGSSSSAFFLHAKDIQVRLKAVHLAARCRGSLASLLDCLSSDFLVKKHLSFSFLISLFLFFKYYLFIIGA
jgi:hypothetical protein